MGLRVRYYLDGIEINPPNNYMGLEIELNYDADQEKQALSINQWEFGVGDPASGNDGMIMSRTQFRDQTGVGVVQGKPFKITIDNEAGKVHTLFDGYIDLWKAKYERGKITADAVQAGGIDWINEYSDSFTFDYLYQNGFFDKSRFVNVPYIIVKKQDSFEIIMTSVSVFVIIDKLKQQTKEITQLIASCSNPLELSAIPRFVLEILYTTSLFVSLVVLITKLVYMLMPPVKYHKGMFVKDLFEIACSYMGFTFKSSILQQPPFDKLFILPEKFNIKENKHGAFAGVAGDFANNNEKTGHFKGTFGDLLRMMKTMFYGKILIDSDTKTLYFEKYDFVLGNSGINVPYSWDNEETFTLNYDEFYATMILRFLVDFNDRSTVQEYLGTSVQVTQTPKGTINQQMSLLRNLREEQIQFALAKRKTELTFIETIVSDFLKVIQLTMDILLAVINAAISAINALISVINKIIKALKVIGIKIGAQIPAIPKINPPQIGTVVDNRIGMLKMESDYISVAKILLLDKASKDIHTKPHVDNEAQVNARYLFENYHYFKSFVSIGGKIDNQHYLRQSDEFPFSFDDYEKSLHNNIIFTPDGLSGRCLSLKFNPQRQTASCSYKQRKHYLSNLKLDIYEPDGQ